jgi:hypothetical protein
MQRTAWKSAISVLFTIGASAMGFADGGQNLGKGKEVTPVQQQKNLEEQKQQATQAQQNVQQQGVQEAVENSVGVMIYVPTDAAGNDVESQAQLRVITNDVAFDSNDAESIWANGVDATTVPEVAEGEGESIKDWPYFRRWRPYGYGYGYRRGWWGGLRPIYYPYYRPYYYRPYYFGRPYFYRYPYGRYFYYPRWYW